MSKLSWFLREFGYDAELLGRNEIDEKALVDLWGVVKVSEVTVHGTSVLSFDGFAPAARWEELSGLKLGRYLCEVRAGQYWRLETLKSFDEFLTRRFPESRRKAYYLMSIHEHLPPQARKQLKEVGWTKGLELAKVARRDGQEFDCATWLHRARSPPKEEFKREVDKELTGRESEPWEMIC